MKIKTEREKKWKWSSRSVKTDIFSLSHFSRSYICDSINSRGKEEKHKKKWNVYNKKTLFYVNEYVMALMMIMMREWESEWTFIIFLIPFSSLSLILNTKKSFAYTNYNYTTSKRKLFEKKAEYSVYCVILERGEKEHGALKT